MFLSKYQNNLDYHTTFQAIFCFKLLTITSSSILKNDIQVCKSV